MSPILPMPHAMLARHNVSSKLMWVRRGPDRNGGFQERLRERRRARAWWRAWRSPARGREASILSSSSADPRDATDPARAHARTTDFEERSVCCDLGHRSRPKSLCSFVGDERNAPREQGPTAGQLGALGLGDHKLSAHQMMKHDLRRICSRQTQGPSPAEQAAW
jgi:hypothetical protein